MTQKVIVVAYSSEGAQLFEHVAREVSEKIDAQLRELPGWEIVSASSVVVPWERDPRQGAIATTVVLQQKQKK